MFSSERNQRRIVASLLVAFFSPFFVNGFLPHGQHGKTYHPRARASSAALINQTPLSQLRLVDDAATIGFELPTPPSRAALQLVLGESRNVRFVRSEDCRRAFNANDRDVRALRVIENVKILNEPPALLALPRGSFS
jgi:hypothetical protein